jgi:hypothetical protein
MTLRYYLTYRGTRLPLTLTEELEPSALQHRNTYLRAEIDEAGHTLWLEKIVYGEVEMRHDYRWNAEGRLIGATVLTADEEPREIDFG